MFNVKGGEGRDKISEFHLRTHPSHFERSVVDLYTGCYPIMPCRCTRPYSPRVFLNTVCLSAPRCISKKREEVRKNDFKEGVRLQKGLIFFPDSWHFQARLPTAVRERGPCSSPEGFSGENEDRIRLESAAEIETMPFWDVLYLDTNLIVSHWPAVCSRLRKIEIKIYSRYFGYEYC